MIQKQSFIPLPFSWQDEDAMRQSALDFYQRMATRRTVRDYSEQPIPLIV